MFLFIKKSPYQVYPYQSAHPCIASQGSTSSTQMSDFVLTMKEPKFEKNNTQNWLEWVYYNTYIYKTFCASGNFSWFFSCLLLISFFNIDVFKDSFKNPNTIRVSNSDQTQAGKMSGLIWVQIYAKVISRRYKQEKGSTPITNLILLCSHSYPRSTMILSSSKKFHSQYWAHSLINYISDKWTFWRVPLFYLLVSSADNLCKQFGPRSDPTKCRAWSGSKLFDTLMVFLKEFFKKVDFEKIHQTTKKHAKFNTQ